MLDVLCSMAQFDRSLFKAGFAVWVENPYPEDDDTHYRKAMPQSARPLHVPAVVERAVGLFVVTRPPDPRRHVQYFHTIL